MANDPERALAALGDVYELACYSSSLARIGAGFLDEANSTQFAREAEDWPQETSLKDVSRLFEVIHLLTRDVQGIASAAGGQSPKFAACRSNRPFGFTAVADRVSRGEQS